MSEKTLWKVEQDLEDHFDVTNQARSLETQL